MTPTQTVRAYCTHCLGMPQFNREMVRDCQGNTAYQGSCPLYPYRLGKRISVKVFRSFCLQCMGGNRDFVRECDTESCPIYPYRMGKNPALTGQVRGASLTSKCSKGGDGGRFNLPESTFRGGAIGNYHLKEKTA